MVQVMRNNMLCEKRGFSPIHFLSSQISAAPFIIIAILFFYLENKWLHCTLNLLNENCMGGNLVSLCELIFLHNHTSSNAYISHWRSSQHSQFSRKIISTVWLWLRIGFPKVEIPYCYMQLWHLWEEKYLFFFFQWR
jgi:hypothetical protein